MNGHVPLSGIECPGLQFFSSRLPRSVLGMIGRPATHATSKPEWDRGVFCAPVAIIAMVWNTQKRPSRPCHLSSSVIPRGDSWPSVGTIYPTPFFKDGRVSRSDHPGVWAQPLAGLNQTREVRPPSMYKRAGFYMGHFRQSEPYWPPDPLRYELEYDTADCIMAALLW